MAQPMEADVVLARRLDGHWAENAPLAEAFREFDRDNPQVYEELVRLCKAWRERRGGKIGAKMLWEVLRWNLTLRTATNEPFKLNNNHTAFYARKLMVHEGLADVFETRRRDAVCECAECQRSHPDTGDKHADHGRDIRA